MAVGPYQGNLVDIWSCGVVLFVLLAGNTPWDEPSEHSWEFREYKRNNGRTDDELWQKLPSDVLCTFPPSLLESSIVNIF